MSQLDLLTKVFFFGKFIKKSGLPHEFYLGVTISAIIIILLAIAVTALIAWRTKIESKLPPQMRWIYKTLPKDFPMFSAKRRRKRKNAEPGRVDKMVDKYEEQVAVNTLEAAFSISLNPSYSSAREIPVVTIEDDTCTSVISASTPTSVGERQLNDCSKGATATDKCEEEFKLDIPTINQYEEIPT